MAGQDVDFLTSIAIPREQFQRSQDRIDQLLALFRPLLQAPIERTLKFHLADAATESWLDVARTTLDAMLREQAPGEDEHDQAEAPLKAQLRDALSDATPVGDDDIAAEAGTCAGELAHLILSRWLDPLATAPGVGNEGLRLNANMLPAALSVEEALSDLACEAYGVDKPFAIQALRQLREQLLAQADSGLVELGPELLIAADAADFSHPYRLFVDPQRARAFAQERQRQPQARITAQDWLARCEAIVQGLVDACFPAYRPRLGVPALCLVVSELLLEGAQPTLAARRYRLLAKSLTPFRWQPAQQLLFDAAVLGVDSVSSGLALGPVGLRRLLTPHAGMIRERVEGYARRRRIPLEVAQDVFVVVMLSGVTASSLSGQTPADFEDALGHEPSALFDRPGLELQAADLIEDSSLAAAWFS
jgi:hypothetical protein